MARPILYGPTQANTGLEWPPAREESGLNQNLLPIHDENENLHDHTSKEAQRNEREERAIQERLNPAKSGGEVRAIRVIWIDQHRDGVSRFMCEGKRFTNFVPKCEVTDGPAGARPLTVIGVAELGPASAPTATLQRVRQ